MEPSACMRSPSMQADIEMLVPAQAFGSKKVTGFVSQAQNEAKHMS